VRFLGRVSDEELVACYRAAGTRSGSRWLVTAWATMGKRPQRATRVPRFVLSERAGAGVQDCGTAMVGRFLAVAT